MAQAVHLEKKMLVATATTFLAGGSYAVLNGISGSGMPGGLPSWLQSLLITFGPTAVTALGTYLAPHTDRPDLAGDAKGMAFPPLEVSPEPF